MHGGVDNQTNALERDTMVLMTFYFLDLCS